ARQDAQPITTDVQPTTADGSLMNVPPGIDNENDYIIAPEVRSIEFSYWDGQTWNDQWDSRNLGADNVTPVGPPVAIAITLEVLDSADPDGPTKKYRHVVWPMTGNGITPQNSNNGSSP